MIETVCPRCGAVLNTGLVCPRCNYKHLDKLFEMPLLPPMPTQPKEGEPSDHNGCHSHITHPCEGCGRIGMKEFKDMNVPQVKIFSSSRNWDDVERDMNSWFEKNQNIKIISITQSSNSSESDYNVHKNFAIAVIYKRRKNKNAD